LCNHFIVRALREADGVESSFHNRSCNSDDRFRFSGGELKRANLRGGRARDPVGLKLYTASPSISCRRPNASASRRRIVAAHFKLIAAR